MSVIDTPNRSLSARTYNILEYTPTNVYIAVLNSVLRIQTEIATGNGYGM